MDQDKNPICNVDGCHNPAEHCYMVDNHIVNTCHDHRVRYEIEEAIEEIVRRVEEKWGWGPRR